MSKWTALVLGWALVLPGCASVKFYSDDGLTKQTGLKYYAPKPYLLVARNETDKGTQVSVVYLPDLEHPQYARFTAGMGSSELKIDFANGILTSYGLKSDTKVAETLTALAAMGTAAGGVIRSAAEAAAASRTAPPPATASVDPETRDAAARKLEEVAGRLEGLRSANATPEGVARVPAGCTPGRLRQLAGALREASDPGDQAAVVEEVHACRAELDALAGVEARDEATRSRTALARDLAGELGKVLEALARATASPGPPTFELYEIRQGPKGSRLVPVVTRS